MSQRARAKLYIQATNEKIAGRSRMTKEQPVEGIFARLSDEHREGLALLEQAASASDYESRAQLWDKARYELLAHERAERQYVYPRLEDHPFLLAFTKQHQSEADQLEWLIADVDASLCEHQSLATLDRLERELRHHAEREEEFFAVARETLGAARASEIEGLYAHGRRSILHELKSPTDRDANS